jgi:hypothetical protein
MLEKTRFICRDATFLFNFSHATHWAMIGLSKGMLKACMKNHLVTHVRPSDFVDITPADFASLNSKIVRGCVIDSCYRSFTMQAWRSYRPRCCNVFAKVCRSYAFPSCLTVQIPRFRNGRPADDEEFPRCRNAALTVIPSIDACLAGTRCSGPSSGTRHRRVTRSRDVMSAPYTSGAWRHRKMRQQLFPTGTARATYMTGCGHRISVVVWRYVHYEGPAFTCSKFSMQNTQAIKL